MEDHRRPAMVEVITIYRFGLAIERLLDALSIIEDEARDASGDDRLTMQDVCDTLDKVVQVLEDLNT